MAASPANNSSHACAQAAGMIITNVGRPVGRFPFFRWSNGEGGYLLHLARVDVSDVRNAPKAEPFYTPLVAVNDRDGMTTVEFRVAPFVLLVFFSPRRINFHVTRQTE